MIAKAFYQPLSATLLLAALTGSLPAEPKKEEKIEIAELSEKEGIKYRKPGDKRGQLFDEGNYAMFIHWGIYSTLANKYKNTTYYGIGEWVMRFAKIPPADYMELAKNFNPVNFDAKAIAQLAKDAGMKYIVITSKHHDGFAIYDSEASEFDVTDASPFDRDPIKELADACREVGIGIGFYYSHQQDWTAPGGDSGPKTDPEGNAVSFEQYFKTKVIPQVEEITTKYGELELVWFDTPRGISLKHVNTLKEIVRKNQPNALINGRIGREQGDYRNLGDMEVPMKNEPGLWESVDTTNKSWGFAWYDENWKTTRQILESVISTVARGGTYMLNVGPKADGTIPERAANTLRKSGEWIKKHPEVIYGAGASPWGKKLPWGDVTTQEETLHLSIYEWPISGELYLPGLKTEIESAQLISGGEPVDLEFSLEHGWTKFQLPFKRPNKLVNVIRVKLKEQPEVDDTFGLDPNMTTTISVLFAEAETVKKGEKREMGKPGEFKHFYEISGFENGGHASWTVNVVKPGDYQVGLTYSGEHRYVWEVSIDGGDTVRNQEGAAPIYNTYPIGWINFPKPGKYTVKAKLISGYKKVASLSDIRFTPAE